MTTLIRWCRAVLTGWDRWIATAIALTGTQTDPEPCTPHVPAGPAPGYATTAPTPPRHPAADTSHPPVGVRSRYPHPPAGHGRASTYPSPL